MLESELEALAKAPKPSIGTYHLAESQRALLLGPRAGVRFFTTFRTGSAQSRDLTIMADPLLVVFKHNHGGYFKLEAQSAYQGLNFYRVGLSGSSGDCPIFVADFVCFRKENLDRGGLLLNVQTSSGITPQYVERTALEAVIRVNLQGLNDGSVARERVELSRGCPQ